MCFVLLLILVRFFPFNFSVLIHIFVYLSDHWSRTYASKLQKFYDFEHKYNVIMCSWCMPIFTCSSTDRLLENIFGTLPRFPHFYVCGESYQNSLGKHENECSNLHCEYDAFQVHNARWADNMTWTMSNEKSANKTNSHKKNGKLKNKSLPNAQKCIQSFSEKQQLKWNGNKKIQQEVTFALPDVEIAQKRISFDRHWNPKNIFNKMEQKRLVESIFPFFSFFF